MLKYVPCVLLNMSAKQLLVERIIQFDSTEGIDFDGIEQRIATLEVEDPDEWTPERLIEKAYSEANMKPKNDSHRITALGKSIEVSGGGA